MNLTNCIVCHAELVNKPTTHDHRFCSFTCYKEYHKNQREMYQKKRSCLWCHEVVYMRTNQRFCNRGHEEKYNKLRQKIGKCFFDNEFLTEIAKFEQQGEKYQLPERIIEDDL